MTEEIIIDGVNVAGCDFVSKIGGCDSYTDGVCEGHNCEHKQLKRLEQENKELKNKNICRETCEYFKRICNENTLLIKYRSALEEIKKVAEDVEDASSIRFYRIKKKINEVLNED